MNGDQKRRLFVACFTGLLHLGLIVALILQPMTNGATNGWFGVDHGQVIEVSLSPLHQQATWTTKTLGETSRPSTNINRAVRNGSREAGRLEGHHRDRSSSQLARATTLEPNTTNSMTDTAVVLYREELAAYLARYRQYPLDAIRNHVEGTVYLHFILSADGKVLSAWIVQSSGSSSLDGEALSDIERAQPLPPIPIGWPRQLDVTIPISFELS